MFKDNIQFDSDSNGQAFAVINVPATQLGSLPLGIDVRLAADILDRYQAELVPLYMNNSLYSDEAFMERQLQSLKELRIDHLYFGGNEALGYPQRLSEVARLLTQYDMHFTLIRSQLGAKQLAQFMEYELLRVIFVEPDRLIALSPAEAADLYELSVRERTVSMIYYPFPKDTSNHDLYDKYVEQIDASMKETIIRLTPDYQLTKAVPLSELVGDRGGQEIYTISAFLGILLLAILFIRQFIVNNWITGIVVTVSVITMGLWYVSSTYAELIRSGYGLLGAIVAPTLAIIIGQEAAEWIRARTQNEHNIRRVLLYACLLYAMVAVVTLSGIVLVVSLFGDMSI